MKKNEYTLKDIVKSWLETAGFEGLYDTEDSCSCPIEKLFQCGEPCLSCRPGYIQQRYGDVVLIRKEKPMEVSVLSSTTQPPKKNSTALLLKKRDLMAEFLHDCWADWMKDLFLRTITEKKGIVERHSITQLDFSIWHRRARLNYNSLEQKDRKKYEEKANEFISLTERMEASEILESPIDLADDGKSRVKAFNKMLDV